ncbi:MAG TPA: UDP-glucuronic acid decarboxylase family protein [Thermoplasmata archaeon]|nr:UDP-glucuronic acid decarboxylase family protein [Thermoplasmata archaeon]
MPRSVVTGGAGFLGSHLCERLLAEGHTVIAVDNLLTGSRENLAPLRKHPKFTFRKQDVSEDLKIPGKVDFVLHFASPASPVDYAKFGIQTLKANALGTYKTLGLAKAKRARYLLASTSEVYGDPQVTPQPETYWGHVNPIGPRSVYDEGKRFAEALAMAYRHQHGLDLRIARIFNTYGSRMRLDDGRVIPNFIGQALRGEPLTVYGDGSQTRSFCYVDELIEGIWRLLTAARVAGPVNLGNPDERTVSEIAALIQKLTGKHVGTVREPLPADDPKVRCPDITKARTVLGWEPRVSLEDGLRRTIAFFEQKAAAMAR